MSASFLPCLADGPPIHSFGDRLRDTQDAISSPAWLLPDPLSNAWLVLNQLAHELAGEFPHGRKFVDRVVLLGEAFDVVLPWY